MKRVKVVIILTLFLFTSMVQAREELPARLQVALMSKILTMEKRLASKQTVRIYVLAAPKIAQLLQQEVGLKLGLSTLMAVDLGNEIPTQHYDVIYIGSIAKEQQAVNYAAQHHVLSLYPIIDGMQNLGSLGLGIKSGKPTFLLNIRQSQAKQLDWNPTILRISKTK